MKIETLIGFSALWELKTDSETLNKAAVVWQTERECDCQPWQIDQFYRPSLCTGFKGGLG